MSDPFDDVQSFHERFGLTYDGPPRTLPPNMLEFRVNFQLEELIEYTQNAINGDLPRQLDALVDQLYVLLGTLYLGGFYPVFMEAWRRVHEANMLKVRALAPADSARGSTFDVVKPPGWLPPTLDDLVIPHA